MVLKEDEFYIKRAIKLAYKGLGFTSPNPPVGAVIVDPKSGEIIGEGYHKAYGAPHAEIEALSQAKEKAKGAYLYVTLEPCCHYGKTPPCTLAILSAGIKRVVVGIKDPNPIACKGLLFLKERGVEVKSGVLAQEVKYLTRFFLSAHLRKRPWVIVKSAQSLDGRIAVSTGDSKWISGERTLKLAHQLRAWCDAILVGKNTILLDNPELTTRLVKGPNPLRIVLDSKANLSPHFKVFQVSEDKRTILVCGDNISPSKIEPFLKKGIEVWQLPLKDNKIDLKALLDKLYQEKVHSLLVEGGGSIQGSFLKEGLIDEVFIVTAPLLIGDPKGIFSFSGKPLNFLKEASPLFNLRVKKLGKDYLFQGLTQEGLNLLNTPLEAL